jgi:hypothetical protein
MLAHRLFVTNDSINNYAHIWYISESLSHGHSLPVSMPVLGHGSAYAYPYAFIPWTAGALLRLVLGDWAVTLLLVTGAALVPCATFWALPELRRPGLATIVLLNPFLIESVVLGQIPFLWATAMLITAIGAWRRKNGLAAVLLCGAAQATHPAVIMPIASLLIVAVLPFESKPTRLIAGYAASVVLALPAAYMVLASPVVVDAGMMSALSNLLGTVAIRSPAVIVPIATVLVRHRLPERIVPVVALGLGLMLVLMIPLRQDQFAWGAFTRHADHSVLSFTQSSAFRTGATYRLLRAADGKVSMYDILLSDGRLDSELFPESIHRGVWKDEASYAAFLQKRHVDFVIIYDSYASHFHTNELEVLEGLTAPGRSAHASLVFHGQGFEVFELTWAMGD